MKITIAYTEPESGLLGALISAIKAVLPPVKVHKSDHSPPFLHVYLTTRKPKNSAESEKID